ncbi:hypothetical protein Tsubulata_005726 [Turnera subulata]|uniref:Diacylglycerol O-acyltransferase n=1 Tax=Turnera subulata TaxID=218843 RepID=A0A9Q0JM12_9ROSI|nr:hypothetical protein Tsubulata_005726 [Turnera subulata]
MGSAAAEHRSMELLEEVTEPVSPTGQYFNSSVLSVCILGVLELEVPIGIDDSLAMILLQDMFIPINPRFSSIMVEDEYGEKQWKRVDVKLQNHVNVPSFPPGLSLEAYDDYFNDYISRIAMQPLPGSQPLWEIHILKYPTRNAAGNLIFKLHHALGDGFSLMGALLSCLQRADNPSFPLTFPSLQYPSKPDDSHCKKSMWPVSLSSIFSTMSDFGWSLLKSGLVEDDPSPIRSGDAGVQFKPITVTTMTFALDDIKEIKTRLGVTINDVIAGIIFYGTRLYMQAVDEKSTDINPTSLVLLNTRNIGGYKSIREMVKPDAESPWGNQFGFLHVSVPPLTDTTSSNPLEFVEKAQQMIKRKKNSLAVSLTGRLLEVLRKLRGPEETAKYIHKTLRNSSMTISNVIGPVENMALANHPVKGLYFMVVGVPQSLTITMVSYTGKLRVAVGAEKGFIDPQKFKACVEDAFESIFKSSRETFSGTN